MERTKVKWILKNGQLIPNREKVPDYSHLKICDQTKQEVQRQLDKLSLPPKPQI